MSLPLDLMDRYDGIFSYFALETDQSYLFDDGVGVWTDIGAHGDVNASIKAFTVDAGCVPAWVSMQPFLISG